MFNNKKGSFHVTLVKGLIVGLVRLIVKNHGISDTIDLQQTRSVNVDEVVWLLQVLNANRFGIEYSSIE